MSAHQIPQDILILGASGLTGSHLLDRVLDERLVRRVTAPCRRALPTHPHLHNPVGELPALLEQLDSVPEVAFCCLGTTQDKAGSDAAFQAIDRDLVVTCAARLRALGVPHLLVVSAVGADPASHLLYIRTKGEMEQALIAQGWPQLTIARPSLLLGPRDEPRPIEQLAAPLARMLAGRWQAIRASTLAHALWRLALEPGSGVRIVESDELRQLGSH